MSAVDHHQMARLLAAARLVTGGLLLVAPGLPARRWLGAAGGQREVKVLARAMGARDVALAVGALRALTAGQGAQPWVLGGAAADATDALATLVGLGHRQPSRALLVALVAAAAAAAGTAASRELGDT
jgi:hypothetical protein